MERNYNLADINDLPVLLSALLGAPEVPSRAGKTKELRHVGITFDQPLNREILLHGRKANIAAQIAETAWVLAGRNDIEWLSHYLPRAADFSDDGKTWRSGYGPRLRAWERRSTPTGFRGEPIDQLASVVDRLREDPNTRQAVAVLWDPATDTQPGKDLACNNWLSFSARDGVLDLHVAVRSNDVMWGFSGINYFEWSVLLEIVAGLTGLDVGKLHFSTTSLHLYERHWEKAQQIIQQNLEIETATASPRYQPPHRVVEDLDDLLNLWFSIEYDIRTGSPMVGGYIDSFPDPMLRSWLQVLDWWWNGKAASPNHLDGTALGTACRMGVQPDWIRGQERIGETAEIRDGLGNLLRVDQLTSPFLQHAIALHNEKHAAYGDSWKRRGDYMILANIARKVDRLGGGETSDETKADTALDLMVYLAKYQTWLTDRRFPGGVDGLQEDSNSNDPAFANALLVEVEQKHGPDVIYPQLVEGHLERLFARLEKHVKLGDDYTGRSAVVDEMLVSAYRLARFRFEDQDQYQGADHE